MVDVCAMCVLPMVDVCAMCVLPMLDVCAMYEASDAGCVCNVCESDGESEFVRRSRKTTSCA